MRSWTQDHSGSNAKQGKILNSSTPNGSPSMTFDNHLVAVIQPRYKLRCMGLAKQPSFVPNSRNQRVAGMWVSPKAPNNQVLPARTWLKNTQMLPSRQPRRTLHCIDNVSTVPFYVSRDMSLTDAVMMRSMLVVEAYHFSRPSGPDGPSKARG